MLWCFFQCGTLAIILRSQVNFNSWINLKLACVEMSNVSGTSDIEGHSNQFVLCHQIPFKATHSADIVHFYTSQFKAGQHLQKIL